MTIVWSLFLFVREVYNFTWLIRKRFPLRLRSYHIWFQDVPKSTNFAHPYGITIRVGTKIGENCIFASNVTIGQKWRESEFAEIGNGVFFGSGSIVLGAVKIGDNAVIGAGAVVTHDVPAGAVVFGNPARIVRTI
jgi:serine acetyltransferase